MKDWKNIALFVTVVLCLFLGWSVFFKGDSAYKERIKQLEKENQELVEKRKELDALIAQRNLAIDSLTRVETELALQLAALETETRLLREEAERSRENWEDVKKRIDENRKKISELKKNPANRKGDALINSLKVKTEK